MLVNNNYRIFNANSLEYIMETILWFIFTDPTHINLNKYSTGNIKFNYRADINNDTQSGIKDFDPLDYKEEF